MPLYREPTPAKPSAAPPPRVKPAPRPLQDLMRPPEETWSPPVPDLLGPATPLREPIGPSFIMPEPQEPASFITPKPEGPASFITPKPEGPASFITPKPEQQFAAEPTPLPKGDFQYKVAQPDIKKMTWAEYNKLSDDERAAVDFNSLLVQAVRKDLRMNEQGKYDNLTADQRAQYDAESDAMFGSELGSDLYAPETLAVLNQLDLVNDSVDFDDFLSLKAAITADDLKRLGQPAPQPRLVQMIDGVETVVREGSGDYDPRNQYVQYAAGQAAELRAKLEKGNQMLQSFRASAAQNRAGYVSSFSGVPSKIPTMPGFGPANFSPEGEPLDLNSLFQFGFAKIAGAQSEAEVQDTLNRMANGRTPEELQQFYTYLDTRSLQQLQNGEPLLEKGAGKYGSAQDFRAILGFDRVGGGNA